MSLTVHPDLVQGSEEWHAVRRGMVTASVVGKLIATGSPAATAVDCPTCGAQTSEPCLSLAAKKTPSPIKTFHDTRTAAAGNLPPVYTVADNDTSRGLTALLTAERLTGHTDPTYLSDDMWRGIEDEPRAVEKYAEHHAPVTTAGFMVRDDWGFPIGYSPDGLVGDDGLVEVKSRRQRIQLQHVIGDAVPADNMAQLQCGLLVSGRAWCDYISYSGGMPLWVKRVHPDPQWFDVIVSAARAFEAAAEELADRYLKAVDGLPMTERVERYDDVELKL